MLLHQNRLNGDYKAHKRVLQSYLTNFTSTPTNQEDFLASKGTKPTFVTEYKSLFTLCIEAEKGLGSIGQQLNLFENSGPTAVNEASISGAIAQVNSLVNEIQTESQSLLQLPMAVASLSPKDYDRGNTLFKRIIARVCVGSYIAKFLDHYGGYGGLLGAQPSFYAELEGLETATRASMESFMSLMKSYVGETPSNDVVVPVVGDGRATPRKTRRGTYHQGGRYVSETGAPVEHVPWFLR